MFVNECMSEHLQKSPLSPEKKKKNHELFFFITFRCYKEIIFFMKMRELNIHNNQAQTQDRLLLL